MICSLCKNIALRIASGKGFCKNHIQEAYAAAKKEKKVIESESSLRAWHEINWKNEERRLRNSAESGFR